MATRNAAKSRFGRHVRLPRSAGRLFAAAAAFAVLAFAAPQFERIVARNLQVSAQLRAARADVASLEAKARGQQRTIARLLDPNGSIPEIHDRLRLVGPKEELIYLQPRHPASPAPPGEAEP